MKHSFASSVLALAVAMGLAGPAAAAIDVNSDPVLFWNDLAIKLFAGGPHIQTRGMAMMNIALHDAVNRTYNGADNYYSNGVLREAMCGLPPR